jgi:hypothetical protein
MANTFKFGNGNWAVKDGSVLAYNDENNNFKPLPFDFTRDSIATRVNRDGLIEVVPNNMPRIDFTDNTSGHLLLEPSRTNVNTYSEALNNWTIYPGVTLTSGQDSPDGGTNAYKIELVSGVNAYVYKGGGTTGVEYTISGYFRADSNVTIGFSDGGFNSNSIDLTTEWKRYTFTYTKGSTGGIQLDNYYGVSPAQEAKTFYAWGLQMEAGSYATSYIPTEGSSVTRVAETSEINSVPNVPTSYPFVMYVEGNHTLGQESGVCGFYDKSNQFQYYSILFSSNNKVLAISRQPGTENVLTSTQTYTDGFHKVAVLFLNDTTIKLYVDGELDSTKTDCSNNSFNTSFTDYVIGVFRSNSTNSCNIKDFRIFNHELTDTELKKLTS